jgi:hypothetical protein
MLGDSRKTETAAGHPALWKAPFLVGYGDDGVVKAGTTTTRDFNDRAWNRSPKRATRFANLFRERSAGFPRRDYHRREPENLVLPSPRCFNTMASELVPAIDHRAVSYPIVFPGIELLIYDHRNSHHEKETSL